MFKFNSYCATDREKNEAPESSDISTHGEHNVNCPDATALQCIVYQVVEHETFKWFLVSHLKLRSGGAYRRYFSHHQTGDYDDFD